MSERMGALPDGKRPNFLVLLVDEMRYPPGYESDAVKEFRRTRLTAQTRLRAHGLEFHRHYIASVALFAEPDVALYWPISVIAWGERDHGCCEGAAGPRRFLARS